MNLNKVYLVGRLTRDPEVRSTPSGRNVASFGLATNRVWVDQSGHKQEQTEFHNIVVWSKLADIAGQYLKKGQLILIEGRLQTRDWVGQDGIKRYRTEIVAENFQMGPKAAGAAVPPTNNPTSTANLTNPTTPSALTDSAPSMTEEQIPTIQVEETVPPTGEQPGGTPNGEEGEVVPF